ncbi:ATP-dependent DNA helicase [Frankliniella fusca]|uniref:ATP-dependent DNA helicase n=1 Tax=Frankliniella fusca TaxID=407009 RepID=A0AAE1HM50_9NEOP|nr:ATP-dependent DNA helicase [Frankliniella fusca]
MNEAMARTSTNNEDDEETNGATFDFDEYSLEDNFTFADIAAELEDDGSRDKVFFIAPEKLPESDFQNLFEKLNQDQRDYIMHVADHFEKTPDKQLLHFLTGGAGLRPVCATALYFPETSNQYAEIFNQKLWNHFKVYILTKIMRQSEVQFQTALNNLARGKLTREDRKLFKSRTFSKMPKKKRLHKAIHLFSRNEDVEEYNNKCLKNIIGEETICHASDVFHGHGSQLAKRQMEYTINKSKTHQTMGLPKSIKLKIGAIYMVTYNVDTEDGICNGATGTLKQINYGINHKGEKKPLRVWIEFDDKSVGKIARKKLTSLIANNKIPNTWTPLDPIALTIKTRKTSSLKVNRKQFPLTLAHALTVHKSQGQSLKQVVVHLGKRRMSREQLYVACSRATSLRGLFIIGTFKEPTPIPKTSHLRTEMKRWKNHKVVPKFKKLTEDNNQLKIMYHNHKPQGVSIYVKKGLKNIITADTLSLEGKGRIQGGILEYKNLSIIGLYAKPNTTKELWKNFFKNLELSSRKKVIIVGDFNIDSNKINTKHFLNKLVQKYKLKLQNKGMSSTHLNTNLTCVVTNTHITTGTYNSFFSHHLPVFIHKA